MPDHDMSQTACQTRARIRKEHDQTLDDIKVLKHEIADLQERTSVLLNMVISFRPEIMNDFEQWSKENPDA